MPGSSLWLVPPESSPLYKAIHSLILSSIPSIYPTALPLNFTPHITLSADTVHTSSEPFNPQAWLDSVPLPDSAHNGDLKLAIREVEIGQVFFRKITMKCSKTSEFCGLAAHARSARVEGMELADAREWIEGNYGRIAI